MKDALGLYSYCHYGLLQMSSDKQGVLPQRSRAVYANFAGGGGFLESQRKYPPFVTTQMHSYGTACLVQVGLNHKRISFYTCLTSLWAGGPTCIVQHEHSSKILTIQQGSLPCSINRNLKEWMFDMTSQEFQTYIFFWCRWCWGNEAALLSLTTDS